VGRAALREIATIATPDTLLRWHRQLIARKWTDASPPGRRGVLLEIRRLVVRMGRGKSDVGVHADPGRAQERRPPRGPLDDSADPEGGGLAAGSAAPDIVADVSPRALGRDRRIGFLHHRSLDVAGPRDVLHGVRHRSGVPPCADSRVYTASGRAVHAADRPDVDDGRGRGGANAAAVDL